MRSGRKTPLTRFALEFFVEDCSTVVQVAQTRLTNRHQRPNIELCRDEPAHRLVEEVNTTVQF